MSALLRIVCGVARVNSMISPIDRQLSPHQKKLMKFSLVIQLILSTQVLSGGVAKSEHNKRAESSHIKRAESSIQDEYIVIVSAPSGKKGIKYCLRNVGSGMAGLTGNLIGVSDCRDLVTLFILPTLFETMSVRLIFS